MFCALLYLHCEDMVIRNIFLFPYGLTTSKELIFLFTKSFFLNKEIFLKRVNFT